MDFVANKSSSSIHATDNERRVSNPFETRDISSIKKKEKKDKRKKSVSNF